MLPTLFAGLGYLKQLQLAEDMWSTYLNTHTNSLESN